MKRNHLGIKEASLCAFVLHLCAGLSQKEEIIFSSVLVCQAVSGFFVCLYSAISYSASQWAFPKTPQRNSQKHAGT